jgi:hypothetical protein
MKMQTVGQLVCLNRSLSFDFAVIFVETSQGLATRGHMVRRDALLVYLGDYDKSYSYYFVNVTGSIVISLRGNFEPL